MNSNSNERTIGVWLVCIACAVWGFISLFLVHAINAYLNHVGDSNRVEVGIASQIGNYVIGCGLIFSAFGVLLGKRKSRATLLVFVAVACAMSAISNIVVYFGENSVQMGFGKLIFNVLKVVIFWGVCASVLKANESEIDASNSSIQIPPLS
jgi:hypothetical protein